MSDRLCLAALTPAQRTTPCVAFALSHAAQPRRPAHRRAADAREAAAPAVHASGHPALLHRRRRPPAGPGGRARRAAAACCCPCPCPLQLLCCRLLSACQALTSACLAPAPTPLRRRHGPARDVQVQGDAAVQVRDPQAQRAGRLPVAAAAQHALWGEEGRRRCCCGPLEGQASGTHQLCVRLSCSPCPQDMTCDGQLAETLGMTIGQASTDRSTVRSSEVC